MNHSKENELKRMNKTAIALATAGAVTLGVAPAAMADQVVGQACFEDAAGKYAMQNVNDKGQALDGNGIAVTQAKGLTKVDDSKCGATPSTTTTTTTPANPTTGTGEKKLFRDPNGALVWLETDPANSNQPAHKPLGGTYTLVDPETEDLSVTPAEGPSDEDIAKAVAAVAGAGVGAAIIINGIKYFVNKDKQTLVPSEDRVNQEPTAEEKAKSDELKANNADQIAQQTGTDATGANTTANGERGMSAATGVNKVPAALMALLLASVLGAAAFVFGRRQLV